MNKKKQCEHTIRTKAIQRGDTAWGGYTHNRVWYCLDCRTVVEVIDECYESDVTLDTFTIEVSKH